MLNKISASAKLYLLTAFTTASLMGMGLYCISYLREMNKNTQTLYADRVLPIQQLANVRFNYVSEVVPLAQNVKNHLLTFDTAVTKLNKATHIINTNWNDYIHTSLTPAEALLVKQANANKHQADAYAESLKAILIKKDTLAINQLILKRHMADTAAFANNISGLIELQVQVGKQVFVSNNNLYHGVSKKFLVLIATLLAVTLSISFYIIKNIKVLIANISKSNAILTESEERYRSLFEQASDAIYTINFKGNFIQVNESLCKIVGYSREELLAMNVKDLLNEELLKLYPLVYDKVEVGTAVIGERKFVHKNGTIIDIEINGKKFADNRVLVIFRDITKRKQMEAELKKAEIRFRTLADKSRVGIYMVQNGVFTYVNPRFAEVFGYEVEELMGKPPVETIIHPSYHHISNENIRKRIDGDVNSVHYEAMGKRKDGSANWVEFYGSRAMIEDEPTIIGTMIDITERKMAEEELRSSEQKYKLIFENNPVPLWMISRDDLSIIAVNQTAANLYGYTKTELINSHVSILRLKEDLLLQKQRFEGDIAGPTDRGVNRHVKKDGTVFFVNIIENNITFEGKEIRLVLTNDITEKLKAEEALRKTDANLQTILNTTDTAYALLDRDLNVLEHNNQALLFAKLEFNFDPARGGNFYDNLPEGRRDKFLEYIHAVFSGQTISYEVLYQQPNGASAWYHTKMFPISHKEGEILGLVLAITDITERKTAEEKLQHSYEQTKKHIAFIREMIWKQSHILRSPLANLKGLVSILQNDPGNDEALEHIETELERMDTVFIEMAADSSKDEMNY